MAAAFVGTTMAAPTFVVRPLLVKARGWTREHLRQQSIDAVACLIRLTVLGRWRILSGRGWHTLQSVAVRQADHVPDCITAVR